MLAVYKFLNRPRADDSSPLSRFYYAHDRLKRIVARLNALNGRVPRNPNWVDEFKMALKQVLNIIGEITDIVLPNPADRSPRNYRVKLNMSEFCNWNLSELFPAQIWFCAECLAAGSNISGRTIDTNIIRPLALEFVRTLRGLLDVLHNQALVNPMKVNTSLIRDHLKRFDCIFVNFEFSMLTLLGKVRTIEEYNHQQELAVLFSETLIRAVNLNYITDEQVEQCDPSIMYMLPRLAITWGLLYFTELLDVDNDCSQLSKLFQKSHGQLVLIRYLLQNLSPEQEKTLECYLISGRYDPTANTADIFSAEKFNAVTTRKLPITEDQRIHRLFIMICAVADNLHSKNPSEVNYFMKIAIQQAEPKNETLVKNDMSIPAEANLFYSHDFDSPIISDQRQFSSTNNLMHDSRWVPDERTSRCTACDVYFCLFRRRHHCRSCGRIFCSRCSEGRLPLPELGFIRPVRICDECFENRWIMLNSPSRRSASMRHPEDLGHENPMVFHHLVDSDENLI
ncbi:FYVE zinc finger domain-containing protein [Ditylenchus destructor]|uniref:FYVE zinc finger domain-containing protein n=1 Tax=Ditylenchus destructor TaxID=166010 RepID=A0AAD4R174_9BILA|nr:FYVE zinc finger domain-containing protein [Ditylenchus destructor]